MKAIIKSLGRGLRDRLLSAAAFLERAGGTQAGAASAAFDGVDIASIMAHVRGKPGWLLQIREVRRLLSRERLPQLMAASGVRRVEADTPSVAHNTLGYNLESAIASPDMDRPGIMVGVVTGIEKVWKNIGTLDILSIGPRSEAEIFALMAAGFSPDRIKALDLFSYSPYVDVGDMHKMPYPDDAFDIVFVGWVLSYSKDQAAAAREYLRVCKPGGIMVLAGDYSSAQDSDVKRQGRADTFHSETTHMQSVEGVLALFEGHVGQVYFQHEAKPPDIAMVMTVFDVIK